MDIRGVEITNQLRSAIRAKLIELGVRYDEELPDYILVMVVNKKSRQQMNVDLNLFLEDNTEPFVNWLHDQVLKKLQKVTVAKKKSNKEIVSTAVIKKEEDGKKVKEENPTNNIPTKLSEVVTKKDRDREFEELVGDLAMLNEEDHLKKSEVSIDKSQKRTSSIHSDDSENTETRSQKEDRMLFDEILTKSSKLESKVVSPKDIVQNNESREKITEFTSQNSKRTSNVLENISNEENLLSSKRRKSFHHSDTDDDRDKSSPNKPKITSVVSVKTRLGVTPPSKKQELQSKSGVESRNSSNRYPEARKHEIDDSHRSSIQSRSTDRKKLSSEDLRTGRDKSSKSQHIENTKNDKSTKSRDLRDKVRLSDRSGSIKSRLGNSNVHKQDKLLSISSSSSKISKPRISSVKSRLGVRNKSLGRESFDSQNFEELDDDAESTLNMPLRSQVIAVPKPKLLDSKQRRSHLSNKLVASTEKKNGNKNMENDGDDDDDDDDSQLKVPSKVIVTPRPLKPLEPLQKRATKSLLLKAVAEANKSVVMKKIIDPCLKEGKPDSKITVKRDLREGKILSVHLNSKKRMVMEQIQVELANRNLKSSEKARSSKMVSDEDFNVVKSLFHRSSDKQKFLVTLNGYNNNHFENQNSGDEEKSDMEINDADEFAEHDIENDQVINEDTFEHNDDQYYEYYENEEDHQSELISQIAEIHQNNRYQSLKNEDSSSEKKRKLSPIVYNRSRSKSPNDQSITSTSLDSCLLMDKRPMISSVITTLPDKSGEKCRYWPNCTLGIKCAYYHPEVSCSSFPACKFGDKCAYKHPKCKFGSACTKLNCIFSHPPIQCKYHPYCMKPGCPFSHPKTSGSSAPSILSPLTPLTPDLSSVRAKFTWKKKD